MLKISFETGLAKATGKPYQYVLISADGVQIGERLYIKPTEKSYYESLAGVYQKQKQS